MTVLYSTAVRGGGFLVSESEGWRSRETVTVAHGQVLKSGHVVGRITAGSAAAPVAAGAGGGGANTGNGTITASPVLETGVLPGKYQIRCIGGTFSVTGAAGAGNSGNGVLTLTGGAGAAFDAATVQAGVYRLVCNTAQSNAGLFTVFDPAGVPIGSITVGVGGYVTQIKASIADGSNDFHVGDYFNVTVVHAVASDSGVFSVTAPTGEPLPNATVGTPYATHLGLTIADGSSDFIVGDGWDITVTLNAQKIKEYNPANSDGSEYPVGIVWDAYDATAADVVGAMIARDAEVNAGELTWFSGASAGQKTAALTSLQDVQHIVARPSV